MSLAVDKALRKAHNHIKVGELAEAEALYKQVISKFPKNKKAIQGYQKLKMGITSKGPSNSETPQEQIDELTSLYDQGQFEEVLSNVKSLSGLFPKDELLFSITGAANAALFRYEAAIECYKKAIKIKPDYADAYYNMGKALQDLGDINAALEIYHKAIKINPNYADAYNNIGTIFNNKDEFDQAISYISDALRISPNDADAYYNMGLALQGKRELNAAIDSYKQALKIKPDFANAHNAMGDALHYKGDLDAAINSFKQALKIKPDFAQATHLVASLTGETTNSAPREYVENLFDGYASKFENSLVEKLEYQAPKIITEMIIKRHPNKALGSVLDLGCGTGIAGLELKQFCQNLEGIDLSNLMLEQARAKGVYDKLIHGDIVEYLANADLDFNYFISADVFIYVGELSDVFRLIKSRNHRQGKLVFSTEHTEKEDFYLETSGRYSHSKNYIDSLCRKYDYHLSHFEKVKLRKEKSGFITGGLYLLDF